MALLALLERALLLLLLDVEVVALVPVALLLHHLVHEYDELFEEVVDAVLGLGLVLLVEGGEHLEEGDLGEAVLEDPGEAGQLVHDLLVGAPQLLGDAQVLDLVAHDVTNQLLLAELVVEVGELLGGLEHLDELVVLDPLHLLAHVLVQLVQQLRQHHSARALEDAVGVEEVGGGVGVLGSDEDEHGDADEAEEEGDEQVDLVLLVHQEAGQPDVEGLHQQRALGTAVLHPVVELALVCQRLIGAHDLDPLLLGVHLLGLGQLRDLVGVVLARHLAVLLLDLGGVEAVEHGGGHGEVELGPGVPVLGLHQLLPQNEGVGVVHPEEVEQDEHGLHPQLQPRDLLLLLLRL
mmetsp:Transcript_14441/g.24640  ORF Transcript_14441/g.24640 Transcript_14441/m.24640 type:complete len:349 (-) Transcript_14441:175-1221(-)